MLDYHPIHGFITFYHIVSFVVLILFSHRHSVLSFVPLSLLIPTISFPSPPPYLQVWDEKSADEGQGSANMNSLLQSLETSDAGGLPMIRPGDASVAAPFTSRTPSVRAVVDLIRQGRCTLLSSLMQQQIMMLESIIAAYTLSALTLNNARSR